MRPPTKYVIEVTRVAPACTALRVNDPAAAHRWLDSFAMNKPRVASSRTSYAGAAAGLLLMFLAGCGGGGGDAPASTAAPASAAAPAAPASAVSSVGTSAVSDCGLADFQASAMARINQWRASGADCHTKGKFAAATSLSWNSRLTQAADGHSKDMVANNFFDHVSADGRTFDKRIDATGYTWSALAENIAAGYPSVNAVIDGWIASDGHCANLMNPAYTEVGLVCVPGTKANTYNNYWTMDLARPL